MSEQPAATQIKPAHAIALAVVAFLLATAVVAMLWLREPEPARRLTLTPPAGMPTGPAVTAPGPATADLQAQPEVQAYRERLGFEQQVQSFLQQADGLSDGERAARVKALEAEIDRMETARQLSAGEAMLLRMHLLNAAGGNDTERMQQAQALARQYRGDAQRRQAAFEQAQQNDPRFRRYKQREADIVAEVQAMQTIPGGMDRDAYLRQRLQEAREAAYAQPAPATPLPGTPSPATPLPATPGDATPAR